jgi:hypothetical protein
MSFPDSLLQPLFFIAALVNIFMGGAAALLPALPLRLLFGVESATTAPTLTFYHITFWLFVVVMGIGYYLVSRNPVQHLGIILIGALGKLSFAGAMVYAYSTGLATAWAFGAIAWDGGLGLLFGYILFERRESWL